MKFSDEERERRIKIQSVLLIIFKYLGVWKSYIAVHSLIPTFSAFR